MIVDVRRAYAYAPAQMNLYIESPAEDPTAHKELLGKLRLSLYGARYAASNWQGTPPRHLLSMGFVRGGAGHPCCYVHLGRSLWTMVHGDDYVSPCYKSELDWLQLQLDGAYEL